jgi:N utilization substance protein B
MEEMLINDQILSRNQIQERIMISLYQYLFYVSIDEKPDIQQIIDNVFNASMSSIDEFARKTIIAAIQYGPEGVEEISKHLKEFTFERLNIVEQALLLMGYAELVHMQMPKQVVINVCVKLAQKFSDFNSFKYINAVLENINNG